MQTTRTLSVGQTLSVSQRTASATDTKTRTLFGDLIEDLEAYVVADDTKLSADCAGFRKELLAAIGEFAGVEPQRSWEGLVATLDCSAELGAGRRSSQEQEQERVVVDLDTADSLHHLPVADASHKQNGVSPDDLLSEESEDLTNMFFLGM